MAAQARYSPKARLAPASTIADFHRYRRALAATVRRLLGGSLPRGAHCRLTPEAIMPGPWLLSQNTSSAAADGHADARERKQQRDLADVDDRSGR